MGKQTVRIPVTRGAIDAGTKGAAYSCPLSLAIRAVIAPGYEVGITHEFGNLSGQGLNYLRFDLPPAARDFVSAIDRGCERSRIEPFEFELELPDEVRL